MSALVAVTDARGWRARRDATSSAAGRSAAGSTTRLAMPQACASAAAIGSPSANAAKARAWPIRSGRSRSEEHTSELQSLMRNSYAVFCLKKKKNTEKKNKLTHKHVHKDTSPTHHKAP